MEVLCFDIGSGGVAAARFDERLSVSASGEIPWLLHRDADGRVSLSADVIESALLELNRRIQRDPPTAVCIGSFMHSFLVLSSCCAPLSPVVTWLDTTAESGMDMVRRRIGPGFHQRTGCHYHPMFPVFKLAVNPPGRGNRVASPKAWLAWELTGQFVDDYGMAAASGLLDVRSGAWDKELLEIAAVDSLDLPRLVNPEEPVGVVQQAGSERFGIPAGTKLVAGSGDGFLANVGTGCTTPKRIAVTLGTSGVARQMISSPVLNPSAGTFCYRASTESFLLGCASSNGGNVLDWARTTFGPFSDGHNDIPIFLPWVHGERSLEWNHHLKPTWHGRTPDVSSTDLGRAAAEGVLFNLAQYVETIERESGSAATEIVLSGNGFLDPQLSSILASVLGRELLHPEESGFASLRGAAVYAWRALGHDAAPELERIVERAPRVKPLPDVRLSERFAKFKHLRNVKTPSEL
jgi:gluconokinase